MYVIPYKRHIHNKSLQKFHKARTGAYVDESMLPINGYIVPGVAMLFLRKVEGGFAIVDSMVTNPWCSSKARHAALEALYKYILSLPFKGLIGYTQDEGALKRAQRHGFSISNQITLVRGS